MWGSSCTSSSRYCSGETEEYFPVLYAADCECRPWDLNVFLSCTADCECWLWDLNVFLSYTADCVCRLWDLNVGQLRSEFRLGSPGMSVRWHPQDPLKVGEERGKQRGGGEKWGGEKGKLKWRYGILRRGSDEGERRALLLQVISSNYLINYSPPE